MKIKSMCLLTALAGCLLVGQVSAHHSFAMFDQQNMMTLKGIVVEFQWTNPHAFIEVNVPNEVGDVERWSVELNSPNNLKRQGWKRKSLMPGDKVDVDMFPLHSGAKGGLFVKVILPDGSTLGEAAFSSGKPINVPTLGDEGSASGDKR